MSDNISSGSEAAGKSVLITGGSGLIGRYLTSVLLEAGYRVSHLSRNSNQFGKVRVFRWEPGKGILDPVVFEGVDYIVHLAGANIGETRWTKKRKCEIINSRVDSAKLLHKVITENKFPVKAFVSASATGYYGSLTSERIFSENDQPANDFLGSVCSQWENAAGLFSSSGIRVVKIRTGVVMEKNDSALVKMLLPARMGVFPRLGSGKQYMPWISIQDLCNIYLKSIHDENMIGAYNAVSPQHVTQSEFMKMLASVLDKAFFHPPVPAVFLKVALGEMADIVLKGSRVSADKIQETGYNFSFPGLESALVKTLT